MIQKIILILFLTSCTQLSEIKINYQSKNIYDIEIDANKILYLCSTPGDPAEPRTFFTIYAISKSQIDSFYTRRLLSLKECKDWLSETD